MSRISVLVADDNRPIRHLLTSALAESFRVLPPVADGRALVQAALRYRPDVIVSDVGMPVLDGITAVRALKSLGCRIPVVMVSADRDAASECLEAGAAAFVCKDELGTHLVPTVLRVVTSDNVQNMPPSVANKGPGSASGRLSETPVSSEKRAESPAPAQGGRSGQIRGRLA